MILAIDLTLTHGGGQQVFLDYVRAIARAGAQPAAMVASGGWIDRSLDPATLRVRVRASSRTRSAIFWRGLRLLQFSWTLLQQRAAFSSARQVVVNDPELFLPAALLAAVLGKDVALYLHMAYQGLGGKVLRLAAALPSVSKLVCVSQFVKRHAEGLLPARAHGKLVVVENALPRGQESAGSDAQPGDVTRIAIIGRLVPEKGQDVVCTLARELPGSVFYLIGPHENSDEHFMEQLRRGAPTNVRFVGYQHPVIDYIRRERIGIVLAPSRIAEAFALVPIEATLAGCAVVVRGLGGLAEVAANVGLPAVDEDGQFEREIRRLQAMPPDVLRERIEEARRRVLARYHPDRFERDVRAAFGWR